MTGTGQVSLGAERSGEGREDWAERHGSGAPRQSDSGSLPVELELRRLMRGRDRRWLGGETKVCHEARDGGAVPDRRQHQSTRATARALQDVPTAGWSVADTGDGNDDGLVYGAQLGVRQ
jgi:hypothetical protein